MCDKMALSSDVVCGFNVGGHCDVGNTSSCLCKEGFSHDFTQLRQRDCTVHYIVFPFFLVIFMIGSLASLAFSLHELSNSQGTAKQILILNSFCGFFIVIFSINFFANGYVFDEFAVICGYFFLSFGFAAAHLIAYSLAAPLYKLAEKSDEDLKKGLKFSNFFFRSVGMILTIVAIAAYGDHKNPANDRGWNIIVGIIFILYGIETAVIQLTTQYVGRRMILAIEILISLTPNNPNHETTRQYVEKVKKLLKVLLINGPGFVFSWITPSLVYLIIGYFPFFNLVVCMTYLLGPMFQFALAIYARRERLAKPSGSTNVIQPEDAKEKQNQKEGENKAVTTFLSSQEDPDELDAKVMSEYE